MLLALPADNIMSLCCCCRLTAALAVQSSALLAVHHNIQQMQLSMPMPGGVVSQLSRGRCQQRPGGTEAEQRLLGTTCQGTVV